MMKIIENLSNTKDIQISEHLSSPNADDTSIQDTITTHTHTHISLSIPFYGFSPRPQAKDGLRTNLLSGAGIIDFLSEEEPKKVFEALKHPDRLEAIRIFLAFATYMNFIVYQMDVKSTFLNGILRKEVYVKQPLCFENSEFPNHVCKLEKAFMDLNKLQEH
ncbi:retrovirus-related pol polyprotein from transposon TNT 1-94, partial [Tanacetum coccineum]